METIVGSGKHTYKVHEDWARVPAGVEMKPAAVAVDPHDRIYCFNRSAEHPVVVFDREGNFLNSWGAGMFRFPHAIRFDDEGFAWLTDGHTMQFMKFTPEGELLQTIGLPGGSVRIPVCLTTTTVRPRGRRSRTAAGPSTFRLTSPSRRTVPCS